MKLDFPKKENGLFILSKDNIEAVARETLSEYAPDNLKNPQPLKICELAEEKLGLKLDYQNLSPSGEICGLISFGDTQLDCYDTMFRPIKLDLEDGTVLIDASLSSIRLNPRRRFTIAHEVSHRILHRSYHLQTTQSFNFRKAAPTLIACRSSNVENAMTNRKKTTDEDWEEWQADFLAAALLMPKDIFIAAATTIISRRTGKRYITQNMNNKLRYDLTKLISDVFVVSHKATEIRLMQLGLVEARTSLLFNTDYSKATGLI